MANPQKEDGYTAIANEIMDALCMSHPGGSEGQVLLAVIRKTYGWKKKEDRLSIGQICEMTTLARRTVIYALKNLEAKNMITVKRNAVECINEVNLISFQKDYSLWVVQEMDGSARKCQGYKATIQKQKDAYKMRVVQEMGGSARKRQGVVQENIPDVPFLAPTKETIQKKTTKENILPVFPKKGKTSGSYSEDFLTFWKMYPKRSGSKKAAWENWRKIGSERPDISLILGAIEKQIEWRDAAGPSDFRPEWKDPERWIKAKMWEAEVGESEGSIDSWLRKKEAKAAKEAALNGHV